MNKVDNQERILKHLIATDIFADIPIELLQQHISEFNLLHFMPNDIIIQKDELGDSMYIIVQGNVKIHDKDFTVATLKHGDYFGEMSLLHAAPRSMSVTAIDDVELINIKQDTFYHILKHQPDLIQKIISNLVIRLRTQNNVLIEEYRSREIELKRQVEEQTLLYREQKERAEESEKFKQQFLANMSHEIRTPMNAVMGMTNLLLDKSPRNDQFQYLNGIKLSSENLLHIINDILDLSKIEAGKMELECIDFSLIDVVNQVNQTLQHKADEKQLKLIIDIDKRIPEVLLGDPVRLNQIIMNLAGNAIKFTEQGSVLMKAELMNSSSKNQIQISVKDTGIGIAEDKLQSVFEGFSQANSSDARKFGGTGLGLTISKQLVEMMGGKIEISSKEASFEGDTNHGTTFHFTIELENGSIEKFKQAHLSEEQIDGHILDHISILVVDDNEYNRIVASDTLQSKTSAKVTTVESAKLAIELIQTNHYDVVLMDLQMPDMDGYEATKYIRNQLPLPYSQIPIVALTASVLRNDLDKCKETGMNSFIPKPFKSSELISGIAEALQIELKYKVSETNNFSIQESGNKVTNLDYLFKFCEGNQVRMRKYIGMFVASVPSVIEKINLAIEDDNYDEIANQVHASRTKLVMMGMKETNALSIQIEKDCRNLINKENTNDDIEQFLKHLEMAIEELV